MTKRAELTIILSCTAIFFICFSVHPLFPVQRYPLFADAPLSYETYLITTPEGLELLPQSFNLQNTYDGDPTYSVGRHPTTAYKWSHILSVAELQEHFKSPRSGVISQFPVLCITRTIWGTQPDKTFGAVSTESLTWANQQLTADQNMVKSMCGQSAGGE
ncbi:hypothetical protein [Bdellovibrio sp. KM01]|uniref:hypothetical protein n=1 Tax=Bdellovibrio sp. KM01 TaxID=2748865 RepID=UPI0015EA26BA|nr:hypothetical protein [Bdellovibrio sp. KM01]QLY26960.1 hypothetical protein HW988_08190 [Bdellovibrio sp. KM01]